MTRYTATYRIQESPGYAVIEPIIGTEAEAQTYAEAQVGTDLKAWGKAYRLLELLALTGDGGEVIPLAIKYGGAR